MQVITLTTDTVRPGPSGAQATRTALSLWSWFCGRGEPKQYEFFSRPTADCSQQIKHTRQQEQGFETDHERYVLGESTATAPTMLLPKQPALSSQRRNDS